MMHYLLLAVGFILLLGGCSATTQTAAPTPAAPCDLVAFQKTATPEVKKKFYLSIQEEIDSLMDRADTFYAMAYYAKAAEMYERVNFYEGREVVSAKRIDKIKHRAKANGEFYYQRAIKAMKKDKKTALYEFNRMMKNDPSYKDGKELYEKLLGDSELEPFLKSLETSLQAVMDDKEDSKKYLKNLLAAYDALRKYNDTSPMVEQAREMIDSQRGRLLAEAIGAYDKGSYRQATGAFHYVQAIYKKDRTAEKYLAKIDDKQEENSKLAEAQKALEEEKYTLAIQLARKVLKNQPDSEEAADIIESAKEEQKKEIPNIIAKAKEYYKRQDFANALETFHQVLELDEDDNTSLTYIKKIEEQLKTIQNLKP